MAGGVLGSMLSKLAPYLSTGRGGWLSGRGDYHINGNTLLCGGMSPPQIINSVNTGGVIVRHREYIQDILATTGFTNSSFPINPGLIGTFPWLASVANAYEQWRPRGMIFEFKSMSSDAVLSTATNSALGTVMMATEYNDNNPPFANKQQMENYEFGNSEKPSMSFIHPIECDKRQTPVTELLVRNGAVPTGGTQQLYDLGVFQIATQGMQAAGGVVGELWCSYEIEFYKPRFNPITEGGSAGLVDHWNLTAITNVNPFGSVSILQPGSTLGGTLSNVTFSFPASVQGGVFLFNWVNQGTGAAALTYPAITVSGGVVGPLNFNSDAATSLRSPATGVTAANMAMLFTVTVATTSCTVTLSAGGAYPTGTVSGDLIIAEVDSQIT